MTTWYHIKPDRLNASDDLIEPVNVSRETDNFLWVDEEQVWNGKRVTRQRRVAKAQGAWRGSYFPTKVAALQDMQEAAARTMERLRKESEQAGKRLIQITAALDQARKQERTNVTE